MKTMTRKEIFDEMAICKSSIDRISEEVQTEQDSEVRMAKIDEMIQLADRMSALDTLNKKLILKDLKRQKKMFIKDLIRIGLRRES